MSIQTGHTSVETTQTQGTNNPSDANGNTNDPSANTAQSVQHIGVSINNTSKEISKKIKELKIDTNLQSLRNRAETRSTGGSTGHSIQEAAQPTAWSQFWSAIGNFFSRLCCCFPWSSRNRADSDIVTTNTYLSPEQSPQPNKNTRPFPKRPNKPSNLSVSDWTSSGIRSAPPTGNWVQATGQDVRVIEQQKNSPVPEDPSVVTGANEPADPEKPKSFGQIIQKTAQNPQLLELDYFRDQSAVQKATEKARAPYLAIEKHLLNEMKHDLEQNCFDETGKLKVAEFQNWYEETYRPTVNQMVEDTIASHKAHAESKLAICAETDQPFTPQQLEAFAAKTRKEGVKALSIAKGTFHFGISAKKGQKLSAATDGLLNNDGSPNFDSEHWQDGGDEYLHELLNIDHLEMKSTYLTRDLKSAEGDRVEGIGGFIVECKLDGQPFGDIRELVNAAKNQYAREIDGEDLQKRDGNVLGSKERRELLKTLPDTLQTAHDEALKKLATSLRPIANVLADLKDEEAVAALKASHPKTWEKLFQSNDQEKKTELARLRELLPNEVWKALEGDPAESWKPLTELSPDKTWELLEQYAPKEVLTKFHKPRWKATAEYVAKINSPEFMQKHPNATAGDKFQALSLEYVFDIMSALNQRQIIHTGTKGNAPTFVNLQETEHLLPFDEYERLAIPGKDWKYIRNKDNAIGFKTNEFEHITAKKITDDSEKSEKSKESLTKELKKLEESGKKHHAQVALFRRKRGLKPTKFKMDYQFHANMHLPSTERRQNVPHVRKLHEDTQTARKVFTKEEKTPFVNNLGGDNNVTTKQRNEYKEELPKNRQHEQELPKGFSPQCDKISKQRVSDPGVNAQYGKYKRQVGGVHTVYSSDEAAITTTLLGKDTEQTGKAMVMVFKTMEDGTRVFDADRSHLTDHDLTLLETSTPGNRAMYTVYVNQLNSSKTGFCHNLGENSENHIKNRPLNCVIKFDLLSGIWGRATHNYDRSRPKDWPQASPLPAKPNESELQGKPTETSDREAMSQQIRQATRDALDRGDVTIRLGGKN